MLVTCYSKGSSTAVCPTRGPADMYTCIYVYTCIRSQEGSRRATGWLRGVLEVALGVIGGLQEGPGRGGGSHDRYELTFSNVFEPSDALSLRFPIFWGSQTLSPYACAARSSRGK